MQDTDPRHPNVYFSTRRKAVYARVVAERLNEMSDDEFSDWVVEKAKNYLRKKKMPKVKILLVDDNDEIRGACKEALIKEEYLVDTALNGEEGLRKIKSEYFDLIVMDLVMPHMDGFEVMEKLKKDKIKYGKLVVFSALNTEELREKAYSFGAEQYWAKGEMTIENFVTYVTQTLWKEDQ